MDVHFKGLQDYERTYLAMREHVAQRSQALQGGLAEKKPVFEDQNNKNRPWNVRDQLWICEHLPVFTQGLAGRTEHVLAAGNIPVVQTDRGGQVTYHGPGQIVAYPLLDLRNRGYFVKEYVHRIEESLIRTLAEFGITGHRVRGAPGIYVRLDDPCGHARLVGADGSALSEKELLSQDWQGKIGKIAALGIKVSRHFTYHGLALNVAMDLEPFERINPCGYAGLRTVDMTACGVRASWQEVAQVLAGKLSIYLA